MDGRAGGLAGWMLAARKGGGGRWSGWLAFPERRARDEAGKKGVRGGKTCASAVLTRCGG